MILTRTVTKKVLEKIVRQTFSTFGPLSSSSLLDSLKFLGFYYATNAGLSISPEDLKTPIVKKALLQTTENSIRSISNNWIQGSISDTERFQTIIYHWSFLTDSLKNRIVNYYQNFDPANNLYIMAFSGARGNLSQVRQLVGMRGLMSDQEGKIIDLPIRANFREGLSSLDYLISSYGARKGIVDTALKTADSGYLTRRLIYLSQDLIIREKNCFTSNGIMISLRNQANINSILGRFFISAYSAPSLNSSIKFKKTFLTNKKIKELKKKHLQFLKVRSPLTCSSLNSICQTCYGWDLSKNTTISLGEAVGIIAAQSIGEPGTQLTMRTFHTGGVFTSETIDQKLAPFSGKLLLPSFLPGILFRTNQGKQVLKTKQEITVHIQNWKGIETKLKIPPNSLLFQLSSCYLKREELISEYFPENVIPKKRTLKSVTTRMEGEIRFEGICRSISKKDNKEISLTEEDGILWVDSGKLFPFPRETRFLYPQQLSLKKAISYQKISVPSSGILLINQSKIILINKKKRIELNLNQLNNIQDNFSLQFSLFSRNYQYIDKFTTIGKVYAYPRILGKIYAIRKKQAKNFLSFFLITDSDIWKLSSDQVNNFSSAISQKKNIRPQEYVTESIKTKKTGRILQKDGCQFIFQHSSPTFLSSGSLLSYKGGDFVKEGEKLATLINSTQQTEDIVQGLPKVEDLIEARIPKEKAILCIYPGIYLGCIASEEENNELKLDKSLLVKKRQKEFISFYYDLPSDEEKKRRKKQKIKKQKEEKSLIVFSSVCFTKNIAKYDGKFWKIRVLPDQFKMIRKPKKNEYNCQFPFTETQERIFIKLKQLRRDLKINKRKKTDKEEMLFNLRPKARRLLVPTFGSRNVTTWEKNNNIQNSLLSFQYSPLKNEEISNVYSSAKTSHWIVENTKQQLFLLELIDPKKCYKIDIERAVLPTNGNFVDCGEPLTEGLIDPHEFLISLFSFHLINDKPLEATRKSINKFQLLLLHSIQGIYQSQGVNIANNHIELIVRQLTSKIKITSSGTTPFLPGEIHSFIYLNEICQAFEGAQKFELGQQSYCLPTFEPLFLSTTNSSLTKKGFLSAAGFQETKRILTTAAIEGKTDWFQGLKECVIIGRLMPAGSAFFTYKNNLNNIYLFKRKNTYEK